MTLKLRFDFQDIFNILPLTLSQLYLAYKRPVTWPEKLPSAMPDTEAKLRTPGFAVRHTSNCTTGPGSKQ